jgi:hypothetical protein
MSERINYLDDQNFLNIKIIFSFFYFKFFHKLLNAKLSSKRKSEQFFKN